MMAPIEVPTISDGRSPSSSRASSSDDMGDAPRPAGPERKSDRAGLRGGSGGRPIEATISGSMLQRKACRAASVASGCSSARKCPESMTTPSAPGAKPRRQMSSGGFLVGLDEVVGAGQDLDRAGDRLARGLIRLVGAAGPASRPAR